MSRNDDSEIDLRLVGHAKNGLPLLTGRAKRGAKENEPPRCESGRLELRHLINRPSRAND